MGTECIAGRFKDWREREAIEHTVESLAGQRVYALAGTGGG